jgi:hypothetical protein
LILLPNASEQYYIVIGQKCIVSIELCCIVATCHWLKRKERNNKERKESFGRELLSEK